MEKWELAGFYPLTVGLLLLQSGQANSSLLRWCELTEEVCLTTTAVLEKSPDIGQRASGCSLPPDSLSSRQRLLEDKA